jgi:hypothetical protein
MQNFHIIYFCVMSFFFNDLKKKNSNVTVTKLYAKVSYNLFLCNVEIIFYKKIKNQLTIVVLIVF